MNRNVTRLVRWFKESYNANPVMFLVFFFVTCINGPLTATVTIWIGRLVDIAPQYLAGSMPFLDVVITAMFLLTLGLAITCSDYVRVIAEGRLRDNLNRIIRSRLLHASIEMDYHRLISSEQQNRLGRITNGFDVYLSILLQETVSCIGQICLVVSYLGVIGFTSSWVCCHLRPYPNDPYYYSKHKIGT